MRPGSIFGLYEWQLLDFFDNQINVTADLTWTIAKDSIMHKRVLLFTISLLIASVVSAQELASYFESQQPLPYQKLYLHTDRAFYFQGDTLWFAAYLLDGKYDTPAAETCNLYLELIDQAGAILQHDFFILQNGLGAGYLSLADTIALEGKYLLRAYTDYLRNFGEDAFYTKPVRITHLKDSDKVERESTGTPKIDISFMPEGGFMLADETNCVAFKAVDQHGIGADVSGKIVDKSGEVVQTFKSMYKGAGKCYFYGQAGNAYRALINGIDQSFALPDLRERGAKIKLIRHGEQYLDMVVQEKGLGIEEIFYLAVMYRGQGLFFIELNNKNRQAVLKLSTDKLKRGINRFVLLDRELNPISERLIFKNDLDVVTLIPKLNNSSFSARDEVRMMLVGFDEAVEIASVSISVVDSQYLEVSNHRSDITSFLFLQSELRGHIESPADYLVDDEHLPAVAKLDLLMTTHGWSNYLWPLLEKDARRLKHQPSLGFDFKGQVKKNFRKKGLEGASVSLIIYEEDGIPKFFDQPVKKQGYFEFEDLVFFDSVSVVAQARSKNNQHNLQFNLQLPVPKLEPVTKQNLDALKASFEVPLWLYEQRLQHDLLISTYDPKHNIVYLEGVEVRGKKIEPVGKTGAVKKNDGPYRIESKNTVGVTDIIEYLQFKVTGVAPIPGGGISLGGGASEPYIMIDGGARLSVDEARGYSVEIFETIEVLTPPASYFYRAPSGIVLLTTKSGISQPSSQLPLLGGMVKRIKGFASLRTCYSPRYSPGNRDTEAPDLRHTLYWNPQTILQNDSMEHFFFTGDIDATYRITIEGISQSGKICVGRGSFVVESSK